MKAYLLDGEERKIGIDLAKCKKPKMTDHRGRTWDHGYIWIDGEKIKVWLDTTWGDYLYFIYKDEWRKVRMQNSNPFAGPRYDIDPFSENDSQIVTQ